MLTDDALREFRSKHLFNKELASGKWSSEKWFRVEEEMDGDVQPFMPLEVSIKSNEVLPARDKAPRPPVHGFVNHQGYREIVFLVFC